MTPPPAPVNLAVVVDRVDLVLRRIDELSAKMDRYESDRNQFLVDYERRHAAVENGIKAQAERLDAHEKNDMPKWAKADKTAEELNLLQDQVGELRSANRIIAWFAGVVGVVVVAWFVGQILGLIK